jgi:alkylhydroperoxidase family enzyme
LKDDPAEPPVAWIHSISEDEADEELAPHYSAERDPHTGRVDHILKVHGLVPASLGDHARLYHTAMHAPGRISLADRELIGLVVSTLNGCRY